ncbi:MAG: DMT family transporter [Oscillospiraceae bacterium]|nr:DMT family transporter [Oscillospiraceae bacterium]
MEKKYFKPMLAAVGVHGIWGFSFLASKYAQMAATPFVVLMYRFDIACLVLTLPWLLGRQTVHLKGKNVRGLLLLGLCEPVIYFIGEQYGVRYTSSAFSGVMIAVIPIVTLMMAAVLLRERPAPLQWVFSAVSIGGVIAITLMAGGGGEITAAGVGFLVLAVLSGSAYAVVSRAISDDFSAYERSLVMQLMGAVFYTAAALIENRADLSRLAAPLASRGFVFGVLYLALGASAAGYMLYNYAVASAPIANVSSLCNLTTVLSVVAGVVVLGEPFSFGSFVALAVILAGIWGVQRFTPREVKP